MAHKTELVNRVAELADITKKQAGEVVNATIEAISSFLAEGEPVQIVGFGTFSVSDRAERKGRNIQTGEEITIPATKVPKFKAGKVLKDAVKK